MIAYCDGVEFGYDDAGQGDPIVFIHGFPHHRGLWAPQVGAMMDRTRCIALDLRGFGESSVTPPFTVEQYADDVAALLDTLKVERAVITVISAAPSSLNSSLAEITSGGIELAHTGHVWR